MSARRAFSRSIVCGVVGAFLAALGASGCSHKTKTYNANVELLRVSPIRFTEDGKAADTDVEFSWFECPGMQVEIIRGDAKFAECMKKYKAGDKVPVRLEHHWDRRGFWDWDVQEMGGCPRPPDDDDLSSFDTVQECEPLVVNGVTEGFTCNRIPQKALLKKCPWFGRR